MLKTVLSFLFISSNVFADTPLSIQDTNVKDYMNCQTIVASHYKNKKTKVRFSECFIESGGVHYNKETAPRRYFYKNKAFMGAVDRLSKGYVFYLPKDLEQTPITPVESTQSSFTCKGTNAGEGQCMICDCFFKDREKTFDEQVTLARVTFSQVISPSFSTSVCKVIHAPGARKWTEKNARTFSKTKPNFKISLGENSKDLNSIQKKQLRRCVRAVTKATKFKNNFFASRYIGKKEKDPKWLDDCNKGMKKGKILLTEDSNLMSYHDWSNDYYKICTQRENRCLTYDTCKAPILGAPKKSKLPSKEIQDALLM